MRTNTPELWDDFWGNRSVRLEEDAYNLIKAENSISWQRIEQIVLAQFGTFENLDVIEIGAGAGTNAALMAKRGAKVTILDYSAKALDRSREFFQRNGLTAEFIYQDALNLHANLLGKYDISMSFGLAEHFKGSDRIKIIKSHFDLLKDGGMAFISVSNKYNLPYRIWKFLAELVGQWSPGEEYPFSRRELFSICEQLQVSEFSFLGDSLYSSFDFIARIIRKIFKIRSTTFDVSSIKKEKGSSLDQYFSYALVLVGKNRFSRSQ